MTTVASLRARLRARVGALLLDAELETGPGTLAIVGPNGAGKTSLLLALLGTLPVDSGRVAIGETVLLDTASRLDVPVEQRRLAYVPQDYALFPHFSVRQNVEFALGSSAARRDRGREAARAAAVLGDLGISELSARRPETLSGGEKQRVALARALSVEPRALLLDEPLAALDVHARRQVRAFLAETLHRLALPSVVVTHDPEDARVLAERILVLESGRVMQVGTWNELLKEPRSRFVEEFVTRPG